MSNLKLTGVGKVFPSGETGLYDVNLEANDKEFLVILGAENSGKSTVLRLIAGLDEPTSGTVFIDGKDMTDVDPKNRDIAMVFTGSSLYASLNVFDNMAFGLRLRRAPEALVQERVKVAANILGLNDVLYRKPKVLNAALKQRVAIGRAVVREPKLYLFDDPLSGLDDKLKKDMLSLIINLQARLSGTFIYATKNPAEALTIGTRIVVMKNGFVQQIDIPANLYDYPANTYVAFCIGAPTINFVKRVKIVKDGDAYTAVTAGLSLPLPDEIVNRFESIDEYAESGRYVTLGIRPEDATVSANGLILGTVDKVEEGEKYAEVNVTPDICLNVGVKEAVAKGSEVKIAVDLLRLHIFDAASCLTLLKKDGGYKDSGLPDTDFVPLPYDEEQKLCGEIGPKKHGKKK